MRVTSINDVEIRKLKKIGNLSIITFSYSYFAIADFAGKSAGYVKISTMVYYNL